MKNDENSFNNHLAGQITLRPQVYRRPHMMLSQTKRDQVDQQEMIEGIKTNTKIIIL